LKNKVALLEKKIPSKVLEDSKIRKIINNFEWIQDCLHVKKEDLEDFLLFVEALKRLRLDLDGGLKFRIINHKVGANSLKLDRELNLVSTSFSFNRYEKGIFKINKFESEFISFKDWKIYCNSRKKSLPDINSKSFDFTDFLEQNPDFKIKYCLDNQPLTKSQHTLDFIDLDYLNDVLCKSNVAIPGVSRSYTYFGSPLSGFPLVIFNTEFFWALCII